MTIGQFLFGTGVLHSVEKPSRYIGGELNQIKKDNPQVKIALCFPDLYDVGMSHTGFHILYSLFNQNEAVACERVFLPWMDMIEKLEKSDIPLYTLESLTPVKDVDMLGITLQYELVYTNVIKVLQLSKIPVLSSDRTQNDPIVIGGGPCVSNPLPVKDFFDAFFIGDGETVYEKIAEIFRSTSCREERLQLLSKTPGIYVPKYYSTIKVTAQKVTDLDRYSDLTRQVIPHFEVVHDRAIVEVMRGCNRGCRFCHAGMFYRPVRERDPKNIIDNAMKALKNTGYEEISFLSLSTLDYSELSVVLDTMMPYFRENRISVSLPSSRVDKFGIEITDKLGGGRRAGLTFAPEAGSQKMRDVINKGIDEEEIFEVVQTAKQRGWNKLKLYFMIGLPGETYEDVKAIAELCTRVKNRSKIRDLTINVSIFVPKPHTPFQYARFEEMQSISEKIRILSEVRKRGMILKVHDSRMSTLEAVMARGDEKLGRIIMKAALGYNAIFQQWDENFDYDKWMHVFEEEQIDYTWYLRERSTEEELEWEFMSCGVSREFLVSEWKKSQEPSLTPDCRWSKCSFCGVCFDTDGKIKVIKK